MNEPMDEQADAQAFDPALDTAELEDDLGDGAKGRDDSGFTETNPNV
jgi:hypothetical protein